MKTRISSDRFSLLTLLLILGLTQGCSDVGFEHSQNSNPMPLVAPSEEDLQTPELPTKGPWHKTGVCTTDQKISGCMSCEGPRLTPVIPTPAPLSKAEKLAQIIDRACQIPNASDPIGFQKPSLQTLRARLAACTSDVYKDTEVNAEQGATLISLLDPSQVDFYQMVFGGLYYQPPFTDHFEEYFGVETQEARNTFCFQNPSISGDLITTEYARECLYAEDGCWAFQNNPKKVAKWMHANAIRKELQSCLDQASQPITAPPSQLPAVPQECKMEVFEGEMFQGGYALLWYLFQNNYKVSIESESQSKSQCQLVPDLPDGNELESYGWVRITGYKCP